MTNLLKSLFAAAGVFALGLFALNPLLAQSASNYWVSTEDGDYLWSNNANWSAGVPTSGDRLVFRSSNAFDASTPSQNDIDGLAINDLIFAGTSNVNGFNVEGNGISLTHEIRNTNSGANMTIFNPDVNAENDIQITTIKANHKQAGNFQLNDNRLSLRNFTGSNLEMSGTVFGGANSRLFVSGDATAKSVLTDTSYIGVATTVFEKGVLATTGNRVDLHDRLYISKYGAFRPSGCVYIPRAFVSRGGFYYPEISGITASGDGACTTQNKVNVRGKVDIAYTTLAHKYMLDSGYTPAKGSRYVIISNDGTDAVKGRFKGLGEGSVLAVGSLRFRITYKGGTGNDIVITRI